MFFSSYREAGTRLFSSRTWRWSPWCEVYTIGDGRSGAASTVQAGLTPQHLNGSTRWLVFPPALLQVLLVWGCSQNPHLPGNAGKAWGWRDWPVGEESACSVGDPGSSPGLGRFPGGGHGNPLQYSCLENPVDRGAWWATVHGFSMSRTRLNDFTFTFYLHALEKEMATHSSVLAWRIPGTGEPGGLPSMGSHRVRHD